MTAEQLRSNRSIASEIRNSILQEAISGRLVPQDPNDEPASILLQHIREEKARLVKEGKLKKNDLVETPITDDEKPFEIPDNWEWVRLGEITSYRRGSFPQPYTDLTSYGGENSMPFVQVADVDENFYRLKKKTKKTISQKAMPFSVFVPIGTVVVTLQGSIGKVAITQYDSYVDRTLAIFNQIYGQINKMFFSIILKNKFENEALHARGATIKTITKEEFQSFILPLPPLAEQKRIVAKLEELLPIVEQYGKAQKELDELNTALPARLRQSILQEAISGRLVPQDPNDGKVDTLLDDVSRIKQQMLIRKEIKKGSLVSIPIEDEEIEYSIPDSWRFVRLQDICTCIFSGKSPKYSQIPTKHKIIGQQSNQWTGVEMRYVKYGTEEYAKDIPQIQYLQDHDVLLNTLGNGTLGRSGIYYSSYSNTPVLTDGHIFVLRTPHEVTAKYILAYLRVKFVDINRSADGSTNQTFLNLTKTSKWIIPLPPLAEQQRIVAKIEELFAEIDKLK